MQPERLCVQVLYLARRKIPCRAVARDAKACEKVPAPPGASCNERRRRSGPSRSRRPGPDCRVPHTPAGLSGPCPPARVLGRPSVSLMLQARPQAVHGALAEGQHQHVTFVTADVTKPATLTPAVRGCAGAIFAATATAGWRLPFASDLEDTPPHVDFEGAVASATAAAAEGVPRFVLISSASVAPAPPHPAASRAATAGRAAAARAA